MPRIRKKTSRRGTTNDRRKISQKVRETRKKRTKEAKKTTQWKSKHKKDPGIPNNYPFKDEILAEIAEQRRLAAEEKQRRKEEKKATARAQASAGEAEGSASEAGPGMAEKDDEHFDGVASISAKLIAKAAPVQRTEAVVEFDSEGEGDMPPTLINHDYPNLRSILDNSDVLIQVLDARDPLLFRSAHLEELAREKNLKVLCILNKIDLCPRESLQSWLAHLRHEYPTFLFRSASSSLPQPPPIPGKSKGKSKESSNDAVGVANILSLLDSWASTKENNSLKVAVVGTANAGKSSFINSLVERKTLHAYTVSTSVRGPTTTELPQEVVLERNGKTIHLIDTPGYLWEKSGNDMDASVSRSRDILARNRGRIDRLKDPIPPVEAIISRANVQDLMLLYALPAFEQDNTSAFLAGVGRSSHLVKKNGVDLNGAARAVLHDWNIGRIKWYSTPSTAASKTQHDAQLQLLYDADEPILSSVSTRKELRKNGGLVKLRPGSIDTRRVLLDAPWIQADSDDESDDGADDDDDVDVEGDDDAEKGEGVDSDEEHEEHDADAHIVSSLSPPPSAKRKRAITAPTPRKKVTFEKSTPSTTAVPLKSALKKTASQPPQNPVTKTPSKVMKVSKSSKVKTLANVPKKGVPSVQVPQDGYDFGKFF